MSELCNLLVDCVSTVNLSAANVLIIHADVDMFTSTDLGAKVREQEYFPVTVEQLESAPVNTNSMMDECLPLFQQLDLENVKIKTY